MAKSKTSQTKAKSLNKKPKSRLDFWNKMAVFLLTIFLVGCVSVFFVLVNIINDPDGMRFTREGLSTLSNSRIFDSNGELIYEFGEEIREDVTYEQLPQSVIDAFLAIEDSRYFEHSGFDMPRFLMAAISNLQTGTLGQGGSTLTMQMIDNAFTANQEVKLTAEQGSLSSLDKIRLKIQEIYLSLIAEQTIDKEDIIEYYVNRVWFGSGGNTRGIQKAANYYFNKDVSELNLQEAAFLAGSVNAPGLYNPLNNRNADDTVDHLQAATERRNVTLDLMLQHGYITQEEYDLAVNSNLAFSLDYVEVISTDPNEAYINQVITEAIELTGQDPTIIPMDIYTALNQEMQAEVMRMVNGEIVSYPDSAFDVGIGVVNSDSGEIIAVGPGRNYQSEEIKHDNSLNLQQPGSAMKPLLAYSSAFDILGWSTEHMVNDKPDDYWHAGFNVGNSDGTYSGYISLAYALGVSKNTTAAATMVELVGLTGYDYWIEFCRKLGFDEDVCINFAEQYCIGGADMFASPIQMASAYTMFANGGDRINAHRIRKIVRRSDKEEIAGNNTTYELISEQAAWLMSYLLRQVVTGGYQNYNEILENGYFPVYAKSGTSDWGDAGPMYGIPTGAIKDEWSLGYTNRFAIAIWSGYTTTYRNMGYYIDISTLQQATAFHMNKYLIEYLSNFEPCAAIEMPPGISSYQGGYIKTEFINNGDSVTYTSPSTEEQGSTADDTTEAEEQASQKACVASGGTFDNGACSCPDGATLNGSTCEYPTSADIKDEDKNQSNDNNNNQQTPPDSEINTDPGYSDGSDQLPDQDYTYPSEGPSDDYNEPSYDYPDDYQEPEYQEPEAGEGYDQGTDFSYDGPAGQDVQLEQLMNQAYEIFRSGIDLITSAFRPGNKNF